MNSSATQQRGNRRAFDSKSFTRAQAVRIIANTTDPDLIQKFSDHNNKHVRRYVFHKLGGTAEIRAIFANLGQLFRLVLVGDEGGSLWPTQAEALEEKKLNQEMSELDALAAQYGEDRAEVAKLYDAKGGDMAALRRSLISRKSARSRAAKKNV